MLASPYENELKEKGDETIDLMVEEVDAALEQYRHDEVLLVPQEAHLFQAMKPIAI